MKITFPLFLSALLSLSVSGQAQLHRMSTISGTGIGGFNGDGIPAASAQLNAPNAVAVDAAGNVYIEDFLNYRIRKIATTGYITTIAGTGVAGSSGDGSVSTSAMITPSGIAVNKAGNLFIADAAHGVIRKVSSTGIISTYAGTGVQGNSGDGGPATSAKLDGVYGMAFDTSGNLYVADGRSNVVRKITPAGIISTFAGNNTAGYNGDGILATDAMLDSPYAVAADKRGNVYIADMKNNRIRKVANDGFITTYAGDGSYNFGGDGGPAFTAQFNRIGGIAVDKIGNLYIADVDNNRIRMVDTFAMISTVAGNGTPGFGGDLGAVNGANLHTPFGVAVDAIGNLYIADANNQRIRKTYDPVGVGHVTRNVAIDVYPNPFNDQLYVSGLDKADNVALYDVAGRRVSHAAEVMNNGSASFTFSGLSAGVYTLQVTDSNGNKVSVTKLVKD